MPSPNLEQVQLIVYFWLMVPSRDGLRAYRRVASWYARQHGGFLRYFIFDKSFSDSVPQANADVLYRIKAANIIV